MSDRAELERDIAEDDEVRRLVHVGDGRIPVPGYVGVVRRLEGNSTSFPFGFIAAALLVVVVAAGIGAWRARLPVASSSSPVSLASRVPHPTPTTLALTGSPCKGVTVAEEHFEDYVPPRSSNPMFTAERFSGLGRVVSIAPNGSSVVVELVNPLLFDTYGVTEVKITSDTSFDYTETIWALVGAEGAAEGATDLPLAPGAPSVDAGQQIYLQCTIANSAMAVGATTAAVAAAGAPSWHLRSPLTRSFPVGTLVSYNRTIHVAQFADLGFAVGQTVRLEFAGTPGDYRASRLTNIVPAYR